MSNHTPIPLSCALIRCHSAEFAEIAGWPFKDSYVSRLLRDDIPQREWAGYCRIWIYRNPEGELVGFGTLDISLDWKEYTEGTWHTYIPLLAVNPTIPSKGYGTGIVGHLIDEAALTVMENAGSIHDVLFLDVYTSNTKGIELYGKLGFMAVPGALLTDHDEGGKEYIVMSKRVSVMRS